MLCTAKKGRNNFPALKSTGGGRIRTTEAEATDLQSAPFDRSGTLPYWIVWSWWTDLNPRPADYKSAALPTELHQLIFFRRSRRLHYNTTSDVICQYLFAKKFIKNHK